MDKMSRGKQIITVLAGNNYTATGQSSSLFNSCVENLVILSKGKKSIF